MEDRKFKMTPKEEERKRVLSEYLNELFEKFDQYKEITQKKYKELEELKEEGDVLIDEIRSVNKIYTKLVSESGDIDDQVNTIEGLLDTQFENNIKGPVSVVEALNLMFTYSPTKEFEPVELKDKLESLRKKNLLNSNAENLLWITHSALKTLLKDNFIIKNKSGSKSTYRKKILLDKKTIKELMIFGQKVKLKKGNNE